MNASEARSPRIALALGGGGARAAYQAGVLGAIGRRYPEFRFPFLTGVSAGAINISLLANHTGPIREQSATLIALWRRLRLNDVFATEGVSLLLRAVRIAMQMAIGLPPGMKNVHGMVNTEPLRRFLREALETSDGSLPGIYENIAKGHLEAVSLTALSYGTGNTVTFYQGRHHPNWEQPRRQSIDTPLTVEHVMASAALPLFFPPIQIDGDWYGDGGIRLVNPLAPALHTKADRILAISNHFLGAPNHLAPLEELDRERSPKPPGVDGAAAPSRPPVAAINEPPSPATILSALYNAVFLDQLDQDVLEMQMINRLLYEIPPEKRQGMREIKLLVIRPSQDIGAIAYRLRHNLPTTLSYLMGRFGTDDISSQDFLSTVLFHSTFIEELIQMGLRDGESLGPELDAFFAA